VDKPTVQNKIVLSLKTRRKVKLEKSKKKEGKEKISSLLPSKNYLYCILINNKERETR
jgi:hypothetical protein